MDQTNPKQLKEENRIQPEEKIVEATAKDQVDPPELVVCGDKSVDSETAGRLVGALIKGHYRIDRLVGSGGVSDVYSATDLLLDRKVALKMLRKQLSDEALLRFQKEARSLSRLNHPNIAAVYEFGATDDGEPFLVMEYIEGTPLNEVVEKDAPLSIEWLVPLLMPLMDALQHAHTASVVHRDIKPSNIMIVKDSRGRDVAKLVDFGIAKLTLGEASSQVETRAGHVFGSPQYMSPEQWLGEQVDHRTDIYSLACVLYELLSGKLPFDGDSALSLMNQHVSRTPMQVGQVDATVRKFDPVLSKAMAKKPEDRQQSVEMLAHEFLTADIARQFSSLETLFTPFQNSNRRWQRKRVNSRNAGRNLALIVGVLLTLTLVIGLVNHQAGWICIGIIVGFAVVLFVNLRFGMPSPSKVAKLSRRNE